VPTWAEDDVYLPFSEEMIGALDVVCALVFGPGRHPTSSAKFLYFQGPDGMVFEYSSGVRSIADELLYRERQFPFEPKGFCQWGAKPKIAEFRT
jgi:2,3-dihydroxy-p-cumate/2,3-dihydroxybenzoate 3,4-dioxygenase